MPSFLGFVVNTDGSLEEIGFLILKIKDNGEEICVGGGAFDISSFGFESQSMYQDTAELIGAVVGLIALVTLGGRDTGVMLRG